MQDKKTSKAQQYDETKFYRFNDAFVKYLLATEQHKKFLIDLLNAVFDEAKPSCIHGRVIDVTLMDRELPTSHQQEKYGRLDICATTDQGQIVDIEVHSSTNAQLLDRNMFYFTKLYSGQPREGLKFSDFQPVVIINLLAKNYFYRFKNYIRVAETFFRDKVYGSIDFDINDTGNHNGETCCKKLTFIFVEAPKCTKLGDRNQSRLTRWMTYLSNSSSSEEEVQQLAKEDKLMADVLEAERVFKKSPDDMGRYIDIESIELDRSDIEKQNMLDVAKSLLVQGVSLEVIKKAFGFDDSDMYELRRQQ